MLPKRDSGKKPGSRRWVLCKHSNFCSRALWQSWYLLDDNSFTVTLWQRNLKRKWQVMKRPKLWKDRSYEETEVTKRPKLRKTKVMKRPKLWNDRSYEKTAIVTETTELDNYENTKKNQERHTLRYKIAPRKIDIANISKMKWQAKGSKILVLTKSFWTF